MQLLLKDGMGIRFHKKPIYGGIAQKWWLGQFADLREEGLAKREEEGRVFFRGVDTPMHTMSKKRRLKGNIFLIYERLQEQ